MILYYQLDVEAQLSYPFVLAGRECVVAVVASLNNTEDAA